MSLTASAVVNLADLDCWHDQREVRLRCCELARVPSGARVFVVVGATAPGGEALRFIREHIERLQVEIQADPGNVTPWLEALRREGFWQSVA